MDEAKLKLDQHKIDIIHEGLGMYRCKLIHDLRDKIDKELNDNKYAFDTSKYANSYLGFEIIVGCRDILLDIDNINNLENEINEIEKELKKE